MGNPDVAELADNTLRVLDRDGWVRGALNYDSKHCVIGAARVAARELNWSKARGDNAVRGLARKIVAIVIEQKLANFNVRLKYAGEIRSAENWNDSTDEAAVRVVLEKVRAL